MSNIWPIWFVLSEDHLITFHGTELLSQLCTSVSLQECTFSIYCIAYIILSLSLALLALVWEKLNFFCFILTYKCLPNAFHILPRYIPNYIYNLSILHIFQRMYGFRFLHASHTHCWKFDDDMSKKIKTVRWIHFLKLQNMT